MLINPIVTVKKKKRQQQKTHKNKTKNTTKTKNKTKRDSRKLLCLLIPISTCMPHFKVSLKRQKGRLLKWAAIYFLNKWIYGDGSKKKNPKFPAIFK